LHSHKFSDPLPQPATKVEVKTELEASIRSLIDEAGGWIDFEGFMSAALYDPKWGYYSSQNTQIGADPGSGSDFVTAPMLSPAFGRALAKSVAQALEESGTDEIWEFGPGTGELARQLLEHLGGKLRKYTLVDVSGELKARQSATLQPYKDKVHWVSELPQQMQGVLIGNEVLDALPVKLLKRRSGVWFEQGVTYSAHKGRSESGSEGGADSSQARAEVNTSDGVGTSFEWAYKQTDLRPPIEEGLVGDYLTEIHPQGEAFVETLVKKFKRGVFFLIDYGFPEKEYYHPQRHMGTLMCHLRHRADDNPLVMVGHKDITAHVNFTGAALAAQNAGAQVLGYTSQAHFLINSGLLEGLDRVLSAERAPALKLINEHEMGELFKVLVVGVGVSFDPIGCLRGDRTHTL
jgi:SAM-dependent MidA family methyltransferase